MKKGNRKKLDRNEKFYVACIVGLLVVAAFMSFKTYQVYRGGREINAPNGLKMILLFSGLGAKVIADLRQYQKEKALAEEKRRKKNRGGGKAARKRKEAEKQAEEKKGEAVQEEPNQTETQ